MLDAIIFGFVLGMVCTVPLAILLHFVWLALRGRESDDGYYSDFP